jgi:hypothetical protein
MVDYCEQNGAKAAAGGGQGANVCNIKSMKERFKPRLFQPTPDYSMEIIVYIAQSLKFKVSFFEIVN